MLPMNGTELVVSLLGGVALLLWGVRMVRTGMTRTFGAALRRLLALYSKSRLRAFLAGLGVTTLMQSSTAAIILLASFAGRGLIALPIALATALGADVGTSLAAADLRIRHQMAVDGDGGDGACPVHGVGNRPDARHGAHCDRARIDALALDHMTATCRRHCASPPLSISLLVGSCGRAVLGFLVAG